MTSAWVRAAWVKSKWTGRNFRRCAGMTWSLIRNMCSWGGSKFFGARIIPRNGRWLIWDKRCQIIPPRTQADCELAWCSDYGAARMFYHYWDGMVKQSEQGISREHPTQKPLALMTWCMGFAPDAQLVLDPYMGSGTTLRAVKDLG